MSEKKTTAVNEAATENANAIERADRVIYVERDTYTHDGKEYYSYFIKGHIRGREVRIGVIPPDKGGYVVLDIVYDKAMKAELVITPFSMKNDAGETISGNTYSVRSFDEAGEEYECKIKPARTSDKELLKMYLR